MMHCGPNVPSLDAMIGPSCFSLGFCLVYDNFCAKRRQWSLVEVKLAKKMVDLSVMVSVGVFNSTNVGSVDRACSSPRCREKREKIKNLITPKSFIAHSDIIVL